MNKRGMGIIGFVLMWFIAIALYFMVFAGMVYFQNLTSEDIIWLNGTATLT